MPKPGRYGAHLTDTERNQPRRASKAASAALKSAARKADAARDPAAEQFVDLYLDAKTLRSGGRYPSKFLTHLKSGRRFKVSPKHAAFAKLLGHRIEGRTVRVFLAHGGAERAVSAAQPAKRSAPRLVGPHDWSGITALTVTDPDSPEQQARDFEATLAALGVPS